MYIVGTSGHIDHGKTSLIRALTGIDCDRLPEEKEREMTIDIGFASIDYPRFGTVSIVDVPGHERFIRNMVAGAWGVDIAMLVIALDDGWMLQTEDHFRVLQLLGIERIIVVINKSDLGDDEMISIVTDDVKEKLAGTRYEGSDIKPVSAKTGQGIAELRDLVLENLKKLAKAADTEKPYMYVDRVFSPRGVGTVVTGTLKNGIFRDNENVTVLPASKEVKIKKIESHYKELQEGVPSQRTALNLGGIAMEELRRGNIICRSNFFTATDDVIAIAKLLGGKKKVKNNTHIELLTGTDSITGKLILLNENDTLQGETLVRIRFDERNYFYPGQPFVLANPGGYRIIGGGRIVIPRFDPHSHRKGLKSLAAGMDIKTREDFIALNIAVNGWMLRENIHAFLPASKRAAEKILTDLEQSGSILSRNDYVIWNDWYTESKTSVRRAVNSLLGPNMKEISDRSGVAMEICAILMKEIQKDDVLLEKDGRFFTKDSVTEDTLTAAKKKVLDELKLQAGDGIELERVTDDIKKKDIRDLVKLGFLVSLDGNIIYHKQVYDEMINKILELFSTRDKITVPEAKDAVGLSRKYILPLLNRIENDGLIKRLGDFRVKA
ncbi:MAG TPA: selenocysteine-specific translation elongation factor [Spirochaetota bacterium]|nr:selenocysteine-specific translation elongation factor [Spirochaetota bacterium]